MATFKVDPRMTPPVRIAFPSLFTKRASMDGTYSSFQCRIMFDKSDKKHMAFLGELAKDYEKVLAGQWPDAASRPRIPIKGHDKSPIKDGDNDTNGQGIPYSEKNPEVAGHYFLNVSNSYLDKLTVVDQRNQPLIDKNAVYAGCWCEVNLNAYARTRKDNLGVSFGLNGVRFFKDDDSFGGGPRSAEDLFGAPSASESAANYGNSADPFGDNADAGDDPF